MKSNIGILRRSKSYHPGSSKKTNAQAESFQILPRKVGLMQTNGSMAISERKLSNISRVSHQSGVVLLVSLIMLLLLTLIGISGTQGTGQQERMAGNMKDRNLAFQAAEAALAEGESEVSKWPYDCANNHGRYLPFDKNCDGTKETEPVWQAIDWSSTANPLKSIAYTGNLGSLSSVPRYIIEDLGAVPLVDCTAPVAGTCPEHYYRTTARATGGTDSAVVMVQSVFKK